MQLKRFYNCEKKIDIYTYKFTLKENKKIKRYIQTY